MKYKVFVDGQEGTTGLKINERLSNRTDLEILKIDPEKRKDTETRRTLLNEADIAFLCLPDVASREAVTLVSNTRTKILDASTAFRTDPTWAYGLPELSKAQRELIRTSSRIAVPGCFATGFNMALYPLTHNDIVPRDYPVTCHSISGYSGGGKRLIEQYENPKDNEKLTSPRFYALGLKHKHLPEMQKITGLAYSPLFTPVVANYCQGMIVAIPLVQRFLNKKMTAKEIHEFISGYYAAEHFVEVMPFTPEYPADNGYFNAMECNSTNKIELFVFGEDEQILLLARLDNLGKGASGAAIQNMNILLGLDEGLGIE
ncbi:MAG: N-acetyl-gamma-glutamyl-phosphate reductase [Candidatus Margulisiibacteriota bacterium]|nr:MAG: N-acetyl-gamma-glutamyl-phosphate reductase [Candidatus Margulisbacteria bacterium GWD2_39_127]OGI02347.1 MAG: N-acetyl-gamma-glutamyl-phosphate reductase [Candidatus Margulisbacteria bacterium GWF2_38_17]OGI09955.1 MAG: N-acetyl-gamma-glutamyl-phosphate reductase [Candidatus Margulisbacteria bacterium GWE2_39_32]PZM78992.1 MAG: N-acetyl-gamma-glutamyl-phosphate reductase [Candidatus Margulisiibacteriota bacterium]HAR62579.1 N-acetyl-gamma-glutamyl-phosphate reductase [Candidatus Margul